MSPIVTIQRQLMELGRIRLGHKGVKGEPVKLDRFRLTSASRQLIEDAARIYGGTAQPWEGAPDEGYFEVYTNTNALPVKLQPIYRDVDGEPTYAYSQWYELWKAGGCERRCDGRTELLTGKDCLCVPHARECKMTTRVSVILPELPGVGVWRLESHGYYAAVLLPGTLDLLQNAASEGVYIDAVLRIEPRTKKVPGEGTRRFIVPVLDVPGLSLGELMGAEQGAINAPSGKLPKPALPAGDDPEPKEFADTRQPDWPEPIQFEPDLDDEIASAREKLLRTLAPLGPLDTATDAIEANAAKNEDDPKKHLAWLRGQQTRAENRGDA